MREQPAGGQQQADPRQQIHQAAAKADGHPADQGPRRVRGGKLHQGAEHQVRGKGNAGLPDPQPGGNQQHPRQLQQADGEIRDKVKDKGKGDVIAQESPGIRQGDGEIQLPEKRQQLDEEQHHAADYQRRHPPAEKAVNQRRQIHVVQVKDAGRGQDGRQDTDRYPEIGGDQLGQNQLPLADRQGLGEVSLRPEKALMIPQDGQHQRQDHHRHRTQNQQDRGGRLHLDDLQCLGQQADQKDARHPHEHHGQQPCPRFGFVFQQFA